MINVTSAFSQRPCRGETVCGDAVCVVERDSCYVVAVADGLGHGPRAADAALVFCNSVRSEPDYRDLETVMHNANNALVPTRGAAGALVVIDRSTGELRFSGIGNIDLQALSAKPIRPVSLPGVLGRRVRTVKVFVSEVTPGDFLAIYSDGISSRFSFKTSVDEARKEIGCGLGASELADFILKTQGKTTDDATSVILHVSES